MGWRRGRPLYGAFFMRAAQIKQDDESVNLKELAAMFRAGLEGIQQRGKAQVGDKTMIDSLQPAVEALEAIGSPEARRLLEACPTVLASTGSACHGDREEPSAILGALGLPADRAIGAVRLSLGRSTTRAQVEQAAAELIAAWRRLGTRAA